MVGEAIVIVSICPPWRITKPGAGERYAINPMVSR